MTKVAEFAIEYTQFLDPVGSSDRLAARLRQGPGGA